MHVRCPDCHQPIELVENAGLEHIDCPSCGSHFSLLGDATASYHAVERRTMGHFELVEKLGVGQFGTVWMARDTELDRTVAIKIPRQEQLSREDVEMFLREARAAAQLHHPNIVSVHEVGREGETVFIVSDLVRGATLADWFTGQRLSPPEAAKLCATIADALHHAHLSGVVHRDLKPSNIMIDSDGQPHLMDFGLAKREAGEITMTMDGRILGTPAYMPPEQARGEAHQADARSDIYSLGTILFQLLTGELPFRGNKRMLLMQIIHDEPPSPRKLDAAVPRDLETICLKCLEKSPERRYGAALDLADELRRYLAGEPIHARPVGRVERSWQWCKRNPLIAALAASVVIVLLAGAGLSTYFAVEADQRADDAEVSAELALRAQRAEADQLSRTRVALAAETRAKGAEARARGAETMAKNEARAAIDRFVDTVNEADLLRDARFQPLRKKLLSDALAYYRAFMESHEHDKNQRRELAEALRRVGFVSAHTGSPEEAIAAFGKAVELSEKLISEHPGIAQYRNDLARTYNDLGLLQLQSGDQLAAETNYKRAAEIEEQLVAEYPAVAEYRRDLAKHLGNLANVQMLLQEREAARGNYQRGIDIGENLAAKSPDVPEYRSLLAKTYDQLGNLQRLSGDHEAARANQKRALEIAEELAARFPAVAECLEDLAKTYANIGERQGADGEHVAARASYEHALGVVEKLVRESPHVAHYRAFLARTLVNLARVQRAAGEPLAARTSCQRAAEIDEKLAAENPSTVSYRIELGGILHELGDLQSESGDHSAAQATYRHVIEIREKLVAEQPTMISIQVELGGAYCNLANAVRGQGRPADSLEPYGRAAEVLQRVLDKQPSNTTARLFLRNTVWGRAQSFDSLGRHAESAKEWRRARDFDDGQARDYFWMRFAEALGRSGDHARAAAETDSLAAPSPSSEMLYGMVRILSICTVAAKDQPALAAGYANRMIDLLRRSRVAGFFDNAANVARLRQDSTFDPLRDRDDFRQFVAQLSTFEVEEATKNP